MIANMSSPDPRQLLLETFGDGGEVYGVAAPGRVNLIGEHIDYHRLPVLPVALSRRVRIAFRSGPDTRIRAISNGYGRREFRWQADLQRVAAGDWENYLRAACQAIGGKWGTGAGIDAAIVSDLPAAAGLSSSSAMIVAFTLALLKANGRAARFEELMEILPDGEQFVGTRGGGMDHAASLASVESCASLIEFDPLSLRPVPIPEGWCFLAAHSLTTAEKSGAARGEYNARRAAGSTALARLGFDSYRAVLQGRGAAELEDLAGRLSSPEEHDSFLHVTSEALRVRTAVGAMEASDSQSFGRLLLESHASLRDRLKVSCSALDRLVETAMECGAEGARLTGAGFGGCVVCFVLTPHLAALRRGLIENFYAGRSGFEESEDLIDVEPAGGALSAIR